VTAALEVASVAGVATLQDGGRTGHMHEGVPPGGALVPELLARANTAVGNGGPATGVEVVGTLSLRALVDVLVSADDGMAWLLRAGTSWTIASRGARTLP
jgi:hypothetical protein